MPETVTISLSKEIKKKLDYLAKKEHLNRSDLVREALQRYFSVKEFQAIRREMIPKARRKGIYTDEDVFRIVS